MKSLLSFLLASPMIAFAACSSNVDSDCDDDVDLVAEKAKVQIVVDNLVTQIETEDMDMLSQIYAHDDDIIAFGTDADERVVGWEALKQLMEAQNGQTQNTEITVSNQAIKLSPKGYTAWFSELLDWKFDFESEHYSFSGVRMSGVLEKRDDGWKIVQIHTSIGVE